MRWKQEKVDSWQSSIGSSNQDHWVQFPVTAGFSLSSISSPNIKRVFIGPLFPIRLHNIYTYWVYACASGASRGAHGKFKMAKLKAQSRRHRAVLRLSIHKSASKVNRSGGDAHVVSCHRYLVIFHPFVEQLTVFHQPRSPCHCAMASWAARAKRYVNYA